MVTSLAWEERKQLLFFYLQKLATRVFYANDSKLAITATIEDTIKDQKNV